MFKKMQKFFSAKTDQRGKSQESMVRENETQERCSRKCKSFFSWPKQIREEKGEIRWEEKMRPEKNVQENAKVFIHSCTGHQKSRSLG